MDYSGILHLPNNRFKDASPISVNIVKLQFILEQSSHHIRYFIEFQLE